MGLAASLSTVHKLGNFLDGLCSRAVAQLTQSVKAIEISRNVG